MRINTWYYILTNIHKNLIMNKFYEINDILSLNNYSKKYGISLRKIYRYISDIFIEHYIIDGIAFLPDKPIRLLQENHTKNQLINNVKILTKCEYSVKNLTLSTNKKLQVVDNQLNNSDKILTECDNNSDKILTLKKTELELMVKREEELSSSKMVERINLIKKYLD